MSNTLREDIPNFKPGDTLSIYVNVREGQKVRQQLFKGTVIARKGSGIAETITVRKMSNGVGVERIFPLHSPSIASMKVDRVNKVRRAKLYYLRGLSGKAARLAEKKIEIVSKNYSFCFKLIPYVGSHHYDVDTKHVYSFN